MKTPVYKCILVREGQVEADRCGGPENGIKLANAMLSDSPCEVMVAILLDNKLRAIGTSVISTGVLDQTMIHPREVFRSAIIANAKAIILAHNHPSGDLAPSNEDYKAKALIEKAGEVLGIALVDFIVVDGLGGGVSLRDAMKTN